MRRAWLPALLLATLALTGACGGGGDAAPDAVDAVESTADAADGDGAAVGDALPAEVDDAVSDAPAEADAAAPGDVPAETPDVPAEATPDVPADLPAEATPDVPADVGPVPFPAPIPLAFPLDGQPLLPVRVDGGEPQPFVIDTGAIRTAADASLLRDVVNGVGLGSFDLGDGVVFPDYEVLAADLAEAVDVIGTPLKGLIGQDLFLQLWFGVDYRARLGYVATAAPTEPPPGYEAVEPVPLPYDLVQGYPVVTVTAGGTELRLIADTGSGVTLVDETLVPADVLAKGLAGYVWYTSYGSDPGTLVRLPDLDVGGVHVAGTWAVALPHDHHLAQVFGMMGIDVDGFLGYPVYREFFVGIRGGEHAYDLWPSGAPDPLAATEWDRVGVEVRRSEGVTLIDMVFAPSDAAAQGLQPQDRLMAVDGAPADALALDQLRLTLRGTPGEPRTLTLLREGLEVDVTVQVERLLPKE